VKRARVLLLLVLASAPAHAEPALAVGGGISAFDGSDGRWNFMPELVGYGTVPLYTHGLSVRAGARAWARGLDQPEGPYMLGVHEHDLALAGELGIVRAGPVLPALAVGGAAAVRWIRLAADDAIAVTDSRIDRTELVPSIYVQASVGVPLHRAGIVVEPYARYEHAFGDARIGLRWGVELAIPIH